MTEDEADEILFLMSQLWWSGHPLPDGTLSVWHTSLMHLERDAAIECVHELAGEKPYWPAISDFRSHYTARVRRKQGEIKPIEREYLPKEENVKRLRELRESLRANR